MKDQEQATFEAEVVNAVADYLKESDDSKARRRKLNRKNWEIYNGRHKFKKRPGQSRTFLHKNALAVEQVVALFKSAILNFDKWIDVEAVGGFEDDIFDAKLVKRLLRFYMEKADVKTVMSDAIKVAVNESDVVIKVSGYTKKDAKNNKTWRLHLGVVPFEDYDRDPTSFEYPMYEIHKIMKDKYRAMQNSKYDSEKIEKLQGADDPDEAEKDRNANNVTIARAARRKRIKIHEFWGTVLDRQGNVMKDPEGMPLENVVLAIANDKYLIRKPEKNPRWANCAPFVRGRLLRVPFANWSKALMDSASDLNITLSELFNLMVDGGMSSVFGIRQVRPDMLADSRQIAGGIPSQTTLVLKRNAKEGKALERVDSGSAPNEVLPFFNIVASLLAEHSFADQTLGSLPAKRVLATELNQARQSLNSVFDGLASDFEESFIEPLAEQCWFEILQNISKFPEEDLIRMLADNEEELEGVTQQVRALNSLTPKQRFDRAAKGFKFMGKGIKTMSARLRDLQRVTTLLGVIGGNQMMMQEFTKKYSMPKLISKVLEAIEIDVEDIELSKQEIEFRQKIAEIRETALVQQEAQGGSIAQGPAGPVNAPSPEPNQDPGVASGATGEGQEVA